jgi:CspA family cold shock protein
MYLVHQSGKDRKGLIMQGVVKVYDPATGVGIILSDGDSGEVMLRPGSLEGSLFRMLRQGQRVVFDATDDNGTLIAGNLRFGADGK